jgi:hypothetical protein
MKIYKHYCILLLIGVLVACSPKQAATPIMCKDIIDQDVMLLVDSAVSVSEFEAWVLANHQVAKEDLTKLVRSDVGTSTYSGYSWDYRNYRYQSEFVKGKLTTVTVRIEKEEISGDDIVRCLGKPTWYVAFHNTRDLETLEFITIYSNVGILIRRVDTLERTFFERNFAITSDKIFESSTISYTRPTDLDTQLQVLYNPLDLPTVQVEMQDLREQISPWRSWMEIKVFPGP